MISKTTKFILIGLATFAMLKDKLPSLFKPGISDLNRMTAFT